MEMKKRMMKYLEKHYSNLSEKEQKLKLDEIIERLKSVNFLDNDTLREVINSLMYEEKWSLGRVLAHLDMIDYDERT